MLRSFGAGRPVLELVGAEVQAQLQWWIACDPASPCASVSLQHGVGCLCASTLGLCVRKAAWEIGHRPPPTWERSAPGRCLTGSSAPAWGCESLSGFPTLGWHREQEDTHHLCGDPWYPANPSLSLVASVSWVHLGHQLGVGGTGLGVFGFMFPSFSCVL